MDVHNIEAGVSGGGVIQGRIAFLDLITDSGRIV
jgi:hypothetical protein